jgi:hypothetical protein
VTTSGTATFNLNFFQIATTALLNVQAIQDGETPGASMLTDASNRLNMIVKTLNATGLHIWTESEATLFLQPGQASYTLGAGSTDHCADVTTAAFTSTTLAASAASSASSISVTSATGFTASYNVGIVLDSGSLFWTTQNGAASGTTINLNSPLTGSASAGNAVYTYQSNIIRPLRVVSGRRLAFNGGIETQMIQMSRIDYRNQPNKSSTGVPTQFFYDPRGGANTQGVISVWPAAVDVASAVNFTWWRPVQDFSANANTPDLPQEWILPLTWALSVELAPSYSVPLERYQILQERAAATLDTVAGWDREPESYLFGADLSQQ